MSLEYLLTSLVVVASPGTGVLYTLASGLSHGKRASALAAFGCTLGIVPHMLAALTGLASLLHTSAMAFHWLKLLGVVYLLYLAWSLLRQRGIALAATSQEPLPAKRLIGNGVLINLLNPKLTLFFLAFLPQFVDTGQSPLVHMLELSFAFMLLTFAVFMVYGISAAAARQRVLARPRVLAWLRRAFAASFLALGVRLALAER